MGSNNVTKAKLRVVETVPSIGDMELGEFVYDSTNSVIALRLIDGIVTFAKD